MEAFYLPVGSSRRFCVFHAAGAAPSAAILLVPAFGEEMNFSRRMAALQARAFAAAGMAVLLIDLFGCGDSEGEFADADWTVWAEDVAAAAQWLHDRTGCPIDYWCIRAGALLLPAAMPLARVPARRLLAWQPVLSGDDYWRYLMRLRQMGALSAGKSLHDPPRAGVIEVAGYGIPAAVANGLQAAKLNWPKEASGEGLCVDLGREVSPPLAKAVQHWRDAGAVVQAQEVAGEAFWQLPEAADNTALMSISLDFMRGGSRAV